MTAPHLNVEGYALRSVELTVGARGPWVADVEFLEPPVSLGATVALGIGDSTLRGAIVTAQSGAAGLTSSVRIIGGAGGWGTLLPPKGYHNDAGVKALTVAQDAASEAGETLGDVAAGASTLGIDYVRAEQPASRTLDYATGDGAQWWVDFDGVTQIGQRATSIAPADAYQLLSFDVLGRVAELVVDDLTVVGIGSTLVDDRLDAPQTIRDLVLRVSDTEPLRVTASCSSAAEPSRLAGLLQALVRQLAEQRLAGCYRYRVTSEGASDKRLTLQAVQRAAGLPNIQLVSQWPGLPGLSADLTLGSQVLVQFVDGDPAQPVVTGYAGPDGASFAATNMVLGGSTGAPAARQGDAVEVLIPPAVLTGTFMGSSITGTLNWVAPTAYGQITTGSGKVSIA